MNRELESDIIHLASNLSYFSDIEIGRFIRKVLAREIEKARKRDDRKFSRKLKK